MWFGWGVYHLHLTFLVARSGSSSHEGVVMNAGDICTRIVVFANQGDSVYRAAQLMRRFDVGNVVVVDEENRVRRPVGIVTDRDITVKVVANGLDPRQLEVGEVMMGDLVTIEESMNLDQIVDVMEGSGVRRLPVVNEQGGLEGIIALDDILDLLAEELGAVATLIQRQQERQEEILSGPPADPFR